MSHMYKSIIHGNAIIWAEKGRRQPWPVSNLTFKNQRQKLCSGLILFLKIFVVDAILLTSDCYKKLLFLSHLKGILVRFWTKLNGFTATSHRCPTCCSSNCILKLFFLKNVQIQSNHSQSHHQSHAIVANKLPKLHLVIVGKYLIFKLEYIMQIFKQMIRLQTPLEDMMGRLLKPYKG